METKGMGADIHFVEPEDFRTGEEPALTLKKQNYGNKIRYRVNTYFK